MKHYTKQNSSLCSLHGKIGIQMNNTVYTSKEKNYQFSSLKPSATKVPHLMFITWHFTTFVLFEYSLMGIEKPKFTRKKLNIMQNFGNTRSVQKCAQICCYFLLKTYSKHLWDVHPKWQRKLSQTFIKCI